MVEQGIENPRVGGSIPSLATTLQSFTPFDFDYAFHRTAYRAENQSVGLEDSGYLKLLSTNTWPDSIRLARSSRVRSTKVPPSSSAGGDPARSQTQPLRPLFLAM